MFRAFVRLKFHSIPRAYDNSIHYGYVRGGRVERGNGDEVAPLGGGGKTSIRPADLTHLFEGVADRVAWTIDLHFDASGHRERCSRCRPTWLPGGPIAARRQAGGIIATI